MQLAGGRIGQKLDLSHTLPQLIENDDPTFGKGAAIKRQFDTLRAAIEQRHTQRAFEVCNGLRDHRPRNGEALCSLGHVALFGDGHEDMKVAWLEPSADTISPVHGNLVPKRLTG